MASAVKVHIGILSSMFHKLLLFFVKISVDRFMLNVWIVA